MLLSAKSLEVISKTEYSECLDIQVNMKKINLDIIKPWITTRINAILGREDNVVVDYVIEKLEAKNLNPKVMQIAITGYLTVGEARQFMSELWMLLVEADMTEDGIPPSLVDKKNSEIKKDPGRKDVSMPSVPVAHNAEGTKKNDGNSSGSEKGMPSPAQN